MLKAVGLQGSLPPKKALRLLPGASPTALLRMQSLLLLILPCKGLLLSLFQELAAVNVVYQHGGQGERGGYADATEAEQNCSSCHSSAFLSF